MRKFASLAAGLILAGCGGAEEHTVSPPRGPDMILADETLDADQRLAAVREAAARGLEASETAPLLIAILLEESAAADLKDAAAVAVFKVGAVYAAVEQLEAALRDPRSSEERQRQAAAGLRRIGSFGLPSLLKAVREAAAPAREFARDELRTFRPAADDQGIETAARQLAQDLERPPRGFDPIADRTPQLLGRLGPRALPQIRMLLGHADAKVRVWALEAVCEMGSPAAPLADALRRLAEDEDADVRQAAEEALEAIGKAHVG